MKLTLQCTSGNIHHLWADGKPSSTITVVWPQCTHMLMS